MNPGDFLGDILEQAVERDNAYWKRKILNADFGRVHMAIMTEPYLSWILEGKKTIESRFSQKRIAPFQKVDEKDIILLKKSGGDIAGVFEAGVVSCFEGLDPQGILTIRNQYNDKICGSDAFWQSRQICRYATLIEVNLLFVLEPIRIKGKNRQSWIVGRHDCIGVDGDV